MRGRHKGALLSALLALSLTGLAQADTLLIEKVRAGDMSGVQRPPRGMSMADVETYYGSPERRYQAVGDPPITRWDYPALSVYFDGDKVVHSVVRTPDHTAQLCLEIALERSTIEPRRIRVLHQAGGGRQRSRHAHADTA